MPQEIRVRLAPSPTGYLHIGTAQSALYNWLFARRHGGKFFLRIEDTDRERSTREYEQSILDSLKWLGLNWDGEVIHQSERNEKYHEVLEKLVEAGKVKIREFSEEERQIVRKEGKKASSKIYILPVEESVQSIVHSDFYDSLGPLVFTDIIRGEISVERKNVGDLIIARVPEDNPDEIIYLYNFVVVVDDLDMGITHVIRGEDHISNTPKQLMIYEALGEIPPQFAHLPLILSPDRSKLSKRHGATSVVDYKNDYLPEALINFLGKLSHTFTHDIVSREKLIEEFELPKVHKSGAVFDIAKLDWINGEYIKKLGDEKLIEKLKPLIDKINNLASHSDRSAVQGGDFEIDQNYLEKMLPMVRERIKKFSDIKEFGFFFKEPEYNPELLIWKNKTREEVRESLERVKEILEKSDLASHDDRSTAQGNDLGEIDKEKLNQELDELAVSISGDHTKDVKSSTTSRGANRGLVYWPLRVALTGLKASPDPVDVAVILGKEKTLGRVEIAIEKLN